MMVPPADAKMPPPPPGTVYTENTLGGSRVFRYTRVKDHYERQMKLYSACSCGSGKKYKFCCNGKMKVVINTDI